MQNIVIHHVMSFLGKANCCAGGHAELFHLCHVIQNDMFLLLLFSSLTLTSIYNEVAFNEKSAIMKENLCTKYIPFTYKYITLNKKLPIMKEKLHIFFFVIGGVECILYFSLFSSCVSYFRDFLSCNSVQLICGFLFPIWL